MNAFVKLRQKISPYLFLVPCLIVFGLFLFYPFAKTIYLSLYKTDKLGQAKLFVGFGNYIDLFTSESFYNSLLVTLIFVVIVVMVSMLLGLVTALLVNKNFPGIRVFSTAYALPMAIASSAAALIFEIMLDPTIGILDKFLRSDINWLHDERYALVCVALLTAWLNSGINYLYFSAGLANIDESIYERASVTEEARRRQRWILIATVQLSRSYPPGGSLRQGICTECGSWRRCRSDRLLRRKSGDYAWLHRFLKADLKRRQRLL